MYIRIQAYSMLFSIIFASHSFLISHQVQAGGVSASDAVKISPTLAFLSNPTLLQSVRSAFGRLIEQHTASLIAPALQNEVRFGATHVPFYHGQEIVHRVYQDILAGIYKAFGNTMPEDFVFLRFWQAGVPQKTAQDFIDAHQEKITHERAFDHDKTISRSVLSTTCSLFGNWSSQGECAFAYYTSNRNASSHTLEGLLQPLFSCYKFDTKYIKELEQAQSLLKDDKGTMCQILIPKSCIERCIYLSHPYGIPYSEPIKDIEGFDVYKKRYAGISSFLTYCCSSPEDMHNTIEGKVQARIVFVPEMLDPKSGVKVFRYTRITSDVLAPYHENITNICEQMVADMKHSKRGL